MKISDWVILVLCLALCLMSIDRCNKTNQNLKLQSDNETLEIANRNILAGVKENKVIIDTFYIEKKAAKEKHKKDIEYINTLDSVQIDSAFDAVYPTQDSAVRTWYHCNEARTQLALSDSIIVIKDTIISSLEIVSLNKDTIISNKDKQISAQRKTTNKWKLIAAVGWLLNLVR